MVNSVGIQKSNVSIKTVSGPTEVNFQPIPSFGGSISVTETVFDNHQGSLTLRNTLSFLDDHLTSLVLNVHPVLNVPQTVIFKNIS